MTTRWRRAATAAPAVLGTGLALVAAAPPEATASVGVFPMPGATTAAPRTEVSFRGTSRARIRDLLVVGSRSGKHRGRLHRHSDGRGASFVPAKLFRPGERVRVRTKLDVRNASKGDFSFEIAHERDRAKPIGVEPKIPADATGADGFRSRPDLRPQAVEVSATPGATPGYVFLAPKGDPGQDGPLIVDDRGEPVFFRPAGSGRRAADFRVQRYRGKPVLTWWQGRMGFGNGAGVGLILDNRYRRVARVKAGNGYAADLHEFQLTARGTALVLAYQPVLRSLRGVGGSRNAPVIDNIVQEIDIATGRVVFEWHSIGQISFRESRVPLPQKEGEPWDYFHANSIDVDADGNLLICARNTWGVYKISRATGSIMWRLGGRRSDFAMGEGTVFAWAHDARRAADGTISIYDNAAAPPVRQRSRVIRLALDDRRRRATLARSVEHPSGYLSASQGNAQSLGDGRTFVGWGSQPFFSELGPDGGVLIQGRIAKGADNYRAYRFPWSARPQAPPDVAVTRAGAQDVVYASWNGATAVARWEVLAGASAGALEPVALAPRTGFETAIAVPAGAGAYAVRARTAAGRSLGRSDVVRPR